jgi:hypothetical protein
MSSAYALQFSRSGFPPSVLGTFIPVAACQPECWTLVFIVAAVEERIELVADRPRSPHAGGRRREHTPVSDDLTREPALVDRIESWRDVRETAEQRRMRQRIQIDAIVVDGRRRGLSRHLGDVVPEADVAGGKVVDHQLPLSQERLIEVDRGRVRSERRAEILVLEIDHHDVLDLSCWQWRPATTIVVSGAAKHCRADQDETRRCRGEPAPTVDATNPESHDRFSFRRESPQAGTPASGTADRRRRG